VENAAEDLGAGMGGNDGSAAFVCESHGKVPFLLNFAYWTFLSAGLFLVELFYGTFVTGILLLDFLYLIVFLKHAQLRVPTAGKQGQNSVKQHRLRCPHWVLVTMSALLFPLSVAAVKIGEGAAQDQITTQKKYNRQLLRFLPTVSHPSPTLSHPLFFKMQMR
jgi:hypothetical protein